MTTSGQEISKLLIRKKFIEVATYGLDCNDWVEIKKFVMKQIGSKHRKLFSRRDEKTKSHTHLNDFEKEMIDLYKSLTGTELVLRTLDERRDLYGRLHR